jgi:hypothetical protein
MPSKSQRFGENDAAMKAWMWSRMGLAFYRQKWRHFTVFKLLVEMFHQLHCKSSSGAPSSQLQTLSIKTDQSCHPPARFGSCFYDGRWRSFAGRRTNQCRLGGCSCRIFVGQF